MRRRCLNTTNARFEYYGGRGIKICARWDSFENFLHDMGEVPEGYSLEREDTNGDYEPTNCKWIPRGEQPNNRRSCIFVEFNGQRQTIADWARETGIPYVTLRRRIVDLKWAPERALVK